MKYLVLILSLLLVSCGPSLEEVQAREKERDDSTKAAQSMQSLEVATTHTEEVVTAHAKQYCDNSHFIIGLYNVNGCEYICFAPNDRGHGESPCVVHAGNCSNPIHSEPVHAILPGRTGDDPVGKY